MTAKCLYIFVILLIQIVFGVIFHLVLLNISEATTHNAKSAKLSYFGLDKKLPRTLDNEEVFCKPCGKTSADDVVIQLPNGAIFGREDQSYTGKTYYNFQKIPYAAPPVGDLRFKAPVPPDNWDDTLNATYLDVICNQITVDPTQQSEDCLYINVYTPELPSEGSDVSIPVYLYIYGGGFTEGHAMQYRRGPEYLIDHDVVVVTFNYRLGPFGFLSTEDIVIPGNSGLKDQQLAIKWVHDNIKLFGGDPDKVTIDGESAGGVSVGLQLLNKNSEGLFRAAMLESGTAINPWAIQRTAKQTAFALASLLNSSFSEIDDSQVLLEYLLTVPADELNEASGRIGGWGPVIEPEHDEAFLTEKMYGLLESGNFVQVPVLIGINSEERLYDVGDLVGFKSLLEFYDNNLQALVPGDLSVFLSDVIANSLGRAIRQLYAGDSPFADNLAAGVRFDSDTSFTRAAIRCAELKSKFTDVFFYQFSYDGPLGNVSLSIEGAEHVAHAEELRYIWRTTRDHYDNSDLSKFPEEDVTTQHRMLTLWTNFVKYLNPTPEDDDLLQNVTWPTITSGGVTDLLYLDIGQDLQVKNHPKEDTYIRWLELYAIAGTAAFDTF